MTQVSPAGPNVRVVSDSITAGLATELHGSHPVSERRHTGHWTEPRLVSVEGCALPPDV